MKRKHLSGLLGLAVFISVLSAAFANQTWIGFVATFPAVVYENLNATLCLRFVSSGSYNKDLNFMIDDAGTAAFAPIGIRITPAQLARKEKCVSFRVSDLDSVTEAVTKSIRIKVQLPQELFDETRSFVLKRISTHNTFISTDKPVYRPGELVKFRVLTLDPSLKPRQVMFKEIQFRDAADSVVDCWKNYSSKYGLMQFESRLTNEPLFGKWTIKVVDDNKFPDLATNYAQFEVKKYRLPKFEVSIRHEPFADFATKNFEIKILALYSFGLPVKGTYTLNVTAIPGMYESFEKIPQAVRDEFKKKTGTVLKFTRFQSTKQCHEECVFKLNLNELTNVPASDLILNRDGFSFNVTVSVAEQGTDSSVQESSLIGPKSNSEVRYDVELVQPTHYKPGLPARIVLRPKIQSNQPKTPVSGPFTIKLVKTGVETVVSEAQPNDEGLIIVTYPNEDKENYETLFIEVLKDDRILKILPVKPWVNERELQMKLYQNSPFKCGQKALVDLKVSDAAALSGQPIFFQIQSKFSTYDLGFARTSPYGDLVVESANNETKEMFRLGAFYDQSASGNLETGGAGGSGNGASRPECDQPQDKGTGNNDKDFVIKYFYDKVRKACEPFIYQGKGGNGNRFDNRTDCQRKCIVKALNAKPSAPALSTKPWFSEVRPEGLFQFEITIPSQLSPKFSIFAFVLDKDQGLIMDYLNGTIDEKCLPNKANVSLNKDFAEVGDRVTVGIKSDPGALCAISAIDKRLTFLKEKPNKLDIEEVFEKLQDFYSESLTEFESSIKSHSAEDQEDSRYFKPSELLKKNKLIVMGNIPMFAPQATTPEPDGQDEGQWDEMRELPGVRGPENMRQPVNMETMPSDQEPSKSTIRRFFPETWIWNLHFLDSKGSKIFDMFAPDSITDWLFDGYCLSNKSGLGISERKTLKVYQNLFLMADLPSTTVAGEKFPINVKVFNQMKFCTPVVLYLGFPDSSFKGDKSLSFERCSCPGDVLDFEFKLEGANPMDEKPRNITAILSALKNDSACYEQKRQRKSVKLIDFYDAEETGLAIKNEGVKQEVVKNDLTFTPQERTQERVFTFEVPDNIAKDSLKVTVKINADLVWPVVENADQIMKQPVGAADHILARMSPFIHVLNYLIQTNQSTDELTNKFTEHLKQDYQRQLAYNTGLDKINTRQVAMRLNTLAELAHLNVMQIDESRLQTDFDLLLINLRRLTEEDDQEDLGDGLSDKELEQQRLALVAFTTMAIMKSHMYIPDIGDDYKASSEYEFLHERVDKLELGEASTMTLAMLYLAFQYEQKNPDNAQQITHKQSIKAELDSRVVKKNGLAYWPSNGCSSASSFDCKKSGEAENASADLEVTSFVLLGRLVDVSDIKKLPPQELETVRSVLKWINSQRNSKGVFEGSLANAAAFESMARYSHLSYKKNDTNLQYQINYTTKSGSGSKLGIIKESNRLAGETVPLTGSFARKNTVKVKITGNGLANIQLTVNYNQMGPKAYSNGTGMYELEPSFETEACDQEKCRKLLRISARYIGEGEQADDMVIISMRLPSKFRATEEGVEEAIQDQLYVQRHHLVPDENLVYFVFETLTNTGVEFDLPLEEKYEIENMKPGLISVYSYNTPSTAAIKPLDYKEE